LDIRQRETSFQQKKSAFLPDIDSYIDYHNYFNDLPTYIFPEMEGSILSGGTSDRYYPVELGLPHNLNIGFKLNQVIYDQNFFLSRRFKTNIDEVNRLNSQLTKEEIIFNVSKTYYEAASLKSQLRLIEFNFERLERIERSLDSQIENGFARESEKSKIMISRSNLTTQKNLAESGLDQMINYLKFQMGMPVEETLDINMEKIDLDISSLPDTASISGNMRIRLMDYQKQINQLKQEQIKNDYYPKLNAFAHFRLQAQRDAFNFFDGNESWFLINLFGVRLDIPILHGGEKRKNLELNEIQSSQMELNRIRLRESLKMEYTNAKTELLNSIETVRMREENVNTVKEAYDQTAALFEEGLVMLNELLDAEAVYREMQSELITARYSYKIAVLKFLKSTGNLLNYSE
jgi:outer membrane protein TolC